MWRFDQWVFFIVVCWMMFRGIIDALVFGVPV